MLDFEKVEAPSPAPVNLLPAGLPLLIEGQSAGIPTILFRAADGSFQLRELAATDNGGIAGTIVDGILPGLSTAFDGQEPGDFALGPIVPFSFAQRNSDLGLPLARENKLVGQPVEIGIIDAGIAFWNPAFLKEAGGIKTSRFASYCAVDVISDGLTLSTAYDQAQLDQIVQLPEHEILAKLAQDFPTSVFGTKSNRPLYRRNGLAHGTAMADLVIQEAPDDVRLHAVELPDSVLRDLTGGQMSVIMETALRRVVERAAEVVTAGLSFDMVVLMAFGFTGGPQDGSAQILRSLEKTLADFAARGINITLVLPVGNHRQDRVAAHLTAGQSVYWRTAPNDFSTNTVEMIQAKGSQAPIIAAPDGAASDLPTGEGLYRLKNSGETIGAVWVSEVGANVITRVSLAPTAVASGFKTAAPHGRWTFSAQGSGADLWVLRDHTGFEGDPGKPFRSSWFDDAGYRGADALGYPALDDALNVSGARLSSVSRTGTASVLATSLAPGFVTVTANVGGALAPYAGQLGTGGTASASTDLAAPAAKGTPRNQLPRHARDGRAVLGNGGPQRFRAAGTSLAAAIETGRIAAGNPSPTG